jgi:hypothetical protein
VIRTTVCAGALFAVLSSAAFADPVIQSADPSALLAGADQAQFAIYGQDFMPADGPGGLDPNEVFHIFVRTVSPAGASPWEHCNDKNGCVWGWTTGEYTFTLGRRWLAAPISQIQIRLFYGFGLVDANDPSQVRPPSSGWSNVFSIPVQAPSAPVMRPVMSNRAPPVSSPGTPVQMTAAPRPVAPRVSMTNGGWPTVTIICPSAQLFMTPGGAPVMEKGLPVVAMRGLTFRQIATETVDGREWRKLQQSPEMTGWVPATCVQ